MKIRKKIHGAITWSGTFKNMPALIGSCWYNGSALYVYKNKEWYEYAVSDELIFVKECSKCGAILPIENVFED